MFARDINKEPAVYTPVKVGDILRNIGSGNAYLVTYTDGKDIVIAVKTVTINNPSEWVRIPRD